jgi:hypothetical protein
MAKTSNAVMWLRDRFQTMCGSEGAGELWTLTEHEASQILDICQGHAGTAMEAAKSLGIFLKREREKKNDVLHRGRNLGTATQHMLSDDCNEQQAARHSSVVISPIFPPIFRH